MKKSSLLKLISLIFVCAMVIGAVAVTAFAAEQTETVEICKKNIEFGDKLRLQFALKAPENVDVSAVCNGEDVEIEYVENIELDGVEYRVYQTVEGWSAQNINAVVTVSAKAGESVDSMSYSVLAYLYERLHLDDPATVTDVQRNAYEALLAYAKAADQLINTQDGRTPNDLDSYHYVSVEGATLDGYNTWGMFKEGETPFANVEHTLVLEEGQAVEWTYSVNGENKGKASLDTIKALKVEGDVVVTATPTCKHTFAYTSADGAIQYKCSKCGEVETSFTVSANGVNTFTAPHPTSFGSNVWNAGNANALNSNGAKGKFGNVAYDAINGVQYTRVNFFAGGQMELLNNSANPSSDYSSLSQTVYGSGQYMVIKLRVGSGESRLRFGIFDSTDEYDTIKNAGGRFSIIRESFAEGWAVYVIDLSKCDLTFWGKPSYACGDSSITKAFYGLMGDDDDGDGNDYVDIAYFAVCDNWSEIDSVVTDETVIFTNWSDPTADVVMTANGTCAGKHKNTYVKGENGLVEYKCSACGTVEKTFTVGADGVNWFTKASSSAIYNRYYVNNYATNNRWAGNFNTDPETGIEFTRVNFQQDSGGGQGQFEILNGDTSITPHKTNVTQTIYGSGNYVVIKMRTSSTASSLGIAMIKSGKTHADWMFGTNTRTAFAEGWAVYVIDMSKYNDCGVYTRNDSTLTKAMFNMRGVNGQWVDIAYFAVCDSWAEVKNVVTDEQVIVTNWTDNNVEKTNLADYND